MSNRAVEVKSGFLTKCGGNFKNWKKRYFVLLGDGTLFYYKAKGDAQPLGTIILDDCKVEKDEKRGKKFCFQISHSSRRTYFLYATTAEEMKSWMETLQQLAATKAIRQVQAIAVGALSKEEEPVSDTDSSDEEGADEALSASGSTASTQQAGGYGGVAAGTDRASWSESGTPSSLELPSELTADISSRYLSEQERKRREEFEKAKNDLSKAIAFGRKSPLVSSAAKRRVTVGSYSSLKTGWLTKCGGSYKNWKKRFFVLRPNLLYYYQKKHDKTPRGIIPLDDCSVDVCADTALLQREHCFKIYHPLRRVYYIEAPDAQEMHRWIEAIDAAIRATPIRAAIVEGLLFSKTVAQGGLKPDNSYHKVVGWVGTLKGIDRKGYLLSKVSKKWHRHYFALKANVLYEFEDEAAEEPKVAVDLKGYFLVPIKKSGEKQKHTFMLQHPEEGRLVFRLRADTADEMNSWMEHLQRTINKETEVELDSFDE